MINLAWVLYFIVWAIGIYATYVYKGVMVPLLYTLGMIATIISIYLLIYDTRTTIIAFTVCIMLGASTKMVEILKD
jgi:hypothetical protein